MARNDPGHFTTSDGCDGERDSAERTGRGRFFASAYGLMACGVTVSATAAFFVAHTPALTQALFRADGLTPAGWAVTFAPLGLVLLYGPAVMRLSADAARALFFVYAALVGASLADIVALFTAGSIGETLAGVALGFAGLALLGATMKTDFSHAGTFLTFTLVAIAGASLLNLLVGSRGLDLALSLVVILFFSVATLYDARRLKRVYEEEAGGNMLDKGAILAALTLYLDLLNPFLAMLRFTGRRR